MIFMKRSGMRAVRPFVMNMVRNFIPGSEEWVAGQDGKKKMKIMVAEAVEAAVAAATVMEEVREVAEEHLHQEMEAVEAEDQKEEAHQVVEEVTVHLPAAVQAAEVLVPCLVKKYEE